VAKWIESVFSERVKAEDGHFVLNGVQVCQQKGGVLDLGIFGSCCVPVGRLSSC